MFDVVPKKKKKDVAEVPVGDLEMDTRYPGGNTQPIGAPPEAVQDADYGHTAIPRITSVGID
jgi:hypothetical protein